MRSLDASMSGDAGAPAAAPVVRTLVLSDLVESTRLVEGLGDARAAVVLARHDRLARDLLARCAGREVDKSDGFLLLFERPADAAGFALAYHAELAVLAAELGVELGARVGIHLGEVHLRENLPADVARGAKPLEVEGLAKAMAARLMALALPGQTLLTRAAFEMAERAAVGSDAFGPAVRWLAHGGYAFKGIERPVDVYEVGVEGRSPLRPPLGTDKAWPAGESAAAGSGQGRRAAARGAMAAAAIAVLALVTLAYRWRGGAVAAPAPGTSLVALPCQVFGALDLAYLTDAVPSTLSALLGQVPGLDVRKPPTSLQWDPARADLTRLAAAYGGTHCVTCTVTVEADQLLVALALVDPATRRQLWSHAYQGARATYLDVLRRSAEDIRETVRPGAPPVAVPSAVSPAGSNASDAELAFQRGMFHLNRYNNLRRRDDFEQSEAALERALELDPRRAEAAGNLALLQIWSGAPAAEFQPQVEAWARKALTIDHQCSRAWTALELSAEYEVPLDRPKLVDLGLRAYRYGPNDPIALWAFGDSMDPSLELSLELFRRATEVDPLYAWGFVGEAINLSAEGRTGEALERLREALRLEPSMPPALGWQAVLLADLGRLPEARDSLAQAEAASHPAAAGAEEFGLERAVLDLAEGTPAARQRARSWIASRLEPGARDPFTLFRLGHTVVPWLARTGETEMALQVLETSIASGAYQPYDALNRNPHFRPLRDQPRFDAVLAHSREHFLEVRRVLLAARARGELPAFLERRLDEVSRQVGLGGI